MPEVKDRISEEQENQGFKHREILEAIGDAIHVVDKNLKIIYQNPAFSKWLESLEMDPIISGRKLTEAFPFISTDTLDEYLHVFSKGEVHFTTESTEIKEREIYTETTKMPLLRNGVTEHVATIIRDTTPQHSSQKALRKSEERYRELYSNLSDALFLTDEEGIITLAGEKAEAIFGYSSEELVGVYFANLVHPAMREQMISAFQSRLKAGSATPEGFEAVGVRKDGSSFTFHITHTIRYSGTTPIGYQSLIRDVTERKKTEAALQEERDRAQMYLDIAGVILVALDAEGCINQINQRGIELLGYKEEELHGKNWFELAMPENEKARTKEVFARLMKGDTGSAQEFESRIVTKSGDERLIAWNNRFLVNSEGGIIGTLSSGEDITEKRKAEKELRESERQYQVIFDAAPIAIGISRETGEILDVNWAMQEMLGYSEEELKQKTAVDVYTKPADRESIRRMLDNDGKVRDSEVMMRRKDGSEIDVLLNVDYVNYQNGIARLSTMRNITELNRTKADLEAARARAEFFNDLMAHDINNVHQGILVGAELLLRGDELPPDSRRYAEAISDQVSRGIQLIENVHKLSKMDADENLALQRIDLYGVIANAILLVQHAFPESEVKIDIKFKAEEIIIHADEFLIDLFYNIVHNAMKYTLQDRGIIEISVDSDEEKGFVLVSIADKGPGIPDERKGDLFSRLEKGRTLGSGMGLTLVKRIANRYQGAAWVEDRVPGTYTMGAKFVVKLPKMASE
ncbi:MAG: PAS domain S-box protein [Candidatus Thorarchaeota archaeon]|nr:PAS domain S-box protein [Candidatus Thorarchaeota archaeon]